MIRNMMWHIFNADNEPLIWDEQAIEFTSKENAEIFVKSLAENCLYIPVEEYIESEGVQIKECILYYDGGYVNLDGKVPIFDNNSCETILINKALS